MTTTTYAMKKELDATYADALARVPEALETEGFGILTEIDVRETLKQKLGVDHRPYKILGACNPPLAHQALTTELAIGVMLPCNVVVYENDAGRAVVLAIDPTETIAVTGNPALVKLASEVKDKLARVLERL